jgi:mannosyltransferase
VSGKKPSFRISKFDLPLVAIIAIGAALRLYRLGAQSFWFDEMVQVKVSMRDISRIVTGRYGIYGDAQPPLSHYLMHFWLKLGSGEFWTRLLPALLGVLTIYVLYVLGRDLLGRKQGICAAFLLAVSPYHIWYSQEARTYSLLMLLGVASMLYFLRSLREGSRTNRFLYALFTVSAMYCHPYAMFLLAVQVAYTVILRRYDRSVKPPIAQFVAICVLFLPWVYVSVNIMSRHLQSPKPIGLTALPYTFYAFTYGFSVGPPVAELRLHQSISSFLPFLPIIVPCAILFTLLAFRGLMTMLPRRTERAILLVLWLLFPILVAWCLAKATGGNYNTRYVCFCLPALLLLLAEGLTSLRHRYLRIAAIAIVTLTCAYSISNYYFVSRYFKDDMRGAARYIEQNSAPEDIIGAVSAQTFRWYYLSRYGGKSPVFELMMQADPAGTVKSEEKRGKYRYLWVILTDPWIKEAKAKSFLALLDHTYRFKGRRDFTGLRVYRYAIRSGTDDANCPGRRFSGHLLARHSRLEAPEQR